MDSNVKKDLGDIFTAFKNVFGRSKFLILLCGIFILIYFVIPKNSVLQTWIEVKNRVVLQVEHNIASTRSKIFAKAELEQKVTELQRKILFLERKLQEQDLMLAEYYNLQNLLQLTPQDLSFHTSRVLKILKDQFTNSMYISGGLGVNSVGNMVIDQSGVIGIISDVRQDYSSVTLYTDPSFKIPCYGLHSGNKYILSGTGKKNVMSLEYIDNDVLEIVEEALVTSGSGGIFVSGIMVGNLRYTDSNYLVYKEFEFISNPFVMVLE